MAFKKKTDLSSDTTVQVGGVDNKTGKPNPKSLEGYFLGTREVTTAYGKAKVHVFQTEHGNVSYFGKTNSNRLLDDPELVGQMVRLTFTGMAKPQPGKAPAYKFELEHDPDNTIDVSTVDTSSQSEEPEEEHNSEEEASEAEQDYTP